MALNDMSSDITKIASASKSLKQSGKAQSGWGNFDFELKGPNPSELNDKGEKATDKAGFIIAKRWENDAKQECPVVTGNLRGSIVSGYDVTSKNIWCGTPVYYAPFVELGTSRQKANPFLKRSFDKVRSYAASVLGKALGDVNIKAGTTYDSWSVG